MAYFVNLKGNILDHSGNIVDRVVKIWITGVILLISWVILGKEGQYCG